MSKLSQIYKIGQVYPFKVKKKYTSQTEIIDESNGINAYLHDTEKLKLFKGQTVMCRITGIGNNRPFVEIVDLGDFIMTSGLTDEKLENLLKENNIEWDTSEFIKLLLTDEKDESFEEQCHQWINSFINSGYDIQAVRDDCSNLLELSALLDLCGAAQREFYQNRLSALIELLGCYIDAQHIIDNGTSEAFVDSLFNKLRISGFVYQPDKNFHILACLFMRTPGIMRRRIAELLRIICDRDITIWKKEPFNSALCRLLELFIRECAYKIDREKDEYKTELVNNILTSLSLELLLDDESKENSVIDPRLTTARLCIISSYLNQNDTVRLLDNAYSYLFSDDVKFLKFGFDGIDNIHYIISNFAPGGNIDSASSFSSATARFTVSPDGICLSPAERVASAIPVFPADSPMWKGMQVYLNSRPETNVVSFNTKDLNSFRDLWAEIENDLMSSTPKRPATGSVAKHHVNEEVEISFIKQSVTDRGRFECRIEDEIGGTGYVTVADIVPYMVNGVTLSMFLENGARRLYRARISEVDVDGNFHFSMVDYVKDAAADYYNDDEEIICRIGKKPHYLNGLAPAISAEGLSVSAFASPRFRSLPAGSVVKCRYKGPSSGNTHVDCEITDVVSDTELDLAEGFAMLMAYAADGVAEEKDADSRTDAVREADKELDEEYVRQIVMCIDRLSILEDDYIKSFNYLAFARLLCMLVGWDSQAAYYKGRMDIITMLHYFDVNSEIDEAELNQLEMDNAKLFESNKPLQERFMQLQAVSYLGKPDHTADLFRLASSNSLLSTLARLVIAYNVVSEESMDRAAIDIHEKIKSILNLKGFGSRLKKYAGGLEGETVEFKTSFVHPPKDKPNQNQRETILQVINSFLNTSGGTLYIGVNDAGRGVGVENELKEAPYHGDKDKYILDVSNAVKLEFGRLVVPFVKIYFDPDNDVKDVLIVEVTKYPEKVPMRSGSYFLRTNSSKEGYTPAEFESVLGGLRARGVTI